MSRTITQGNVRALELARRSPYPHMSRFDAAIWKKFLGHDHPTITKVAYDERVGKLREVPDEEDPAIVSMWATLTAKRIDAVIWIPGAVWVIEVKPVGSMAALGQAQTYALLWRREHLPRLPVVPVVVCDFVDEDMQAVYIELGVGLIIMGTGAESGPAPVQVFGGKPVGLLGFPS